MGTKKRVQSKAKRIRVSVAKLSNKRLNKLAKQGKLKTRIKKHKLKQLLEQRTGSHAAANLSEDEGQEGNAEIPLDDVDFEYFSSPGANLKFLSRFDDSGETRRNRKRKNKGEDAEEASFEQLPRKHSKVSEPQKNMKALLPIKSNSGVIPQMMELEEDKNEEDDEEKEADEVESQEESEPLPPLSVAEITEQRRLKLTEKKNQIGMLASAVVENPEENTRKLKELRLMLNETDPDLYITVRKFALVTLTEVFKDIIPGYRIRQLTQTEKQQKMKKETKKMMDFENSLLSNYRHFLEFLELLITGRSTFHKKKKQLNGTSLNKDTTKVLREIAVRCLCDLIVTHPHFNFRNNIIAVVVPLMDAKNRQISDLVCDCIRRLYKEDKSAEVPLEIVRLSARLIKARKFQVHPKVLNTFLALKLKNINFDAIQNTDKKMYREEKFKKTSRRDRKKQKQMESLEKELQEASGTEDKGKRMKRQTEIVEIVFLTYFRILKTAPESVLLSSVLEGLAKFAHLINIDFFDDLFTVINQLIESEKLSYRESLHCVQTAFTILTGEGSALNIDPLRFYKHFYNAVFKLHAGCSSEDVPIALECLNLMFNKRKKQISYPRLLAFIKRLTTLSLQLLPHSCLGAMATIRSLLQVDSKTDVLYEAESHGSGMFQPELPDPEHCNAHNTAVFELHTLRRHYHPVVRRYANHLCAGAPSQGNHQLPLDLVRAEPVRLCEQYNPEQMDFRPPVQQKPQKICKLPKRAPGSLYQEDLEKFVSETVETLCSSLVNTRQDLENTDFFLQIKRKKIT